jgi:alkyl hydroperoxide reductase subunit AhpF
LLLLRDPKAPVIHWHNVNLSCHNFFITKSTTRCPHSTGDVFEVSSCHESVSEQSFQYYLAEIVFRNIILFPNVLRLRRVIVPN